VTESYNEHKWGAVYWHDDDDDDDDDNDVIFSGTLVLIRKLL
jgi:hypothetical protein